MNVLALTIPVMTMQLVKILKEVTPALAILDTQAMDFLVQVSYILGEHGILTNTSRLK